MLESEFTQNFITISFFLSYGCEICLIREKTDEEDSLLQENLNSRKILP